MRDYSERALTVQEKQWLELGFLEMMEMYKDTKFEGDKTQAIISIMRQFDNMQEENPTDTRVNLHDVFKYLWRLQ